MIRLYNISSFIRKIIILSLFVFAPIGILPVTVLLREGGRVKGDIITQNQSSILLQTESGKRKIDKDSVLKVLFHDVDDDQEEKIRKDEEGKLAADKKEQEDKDLAQRQLDEEKLKQDQLKKDEEAAAAAAEEARKQEELRRLAAGRPYNSLWRSAVIPGWGQFYSDRKFQGIIYPTLFAAAAFVSYDKYRVYREAVKEYGEIGNPYSQTNILLTLSGHPPTTITSTTSTSPLSAYLADKFSPSQIKLKREEADSDFREYQGTLYVLGGIYLINLIDSFFFANSIKSTVQMSDGKSKGMILSAVPSGVSSASANTGSGSYSGMETKYTFGYRFQF
ncbi:hypothetical protein EHO59_10020 [Leptospira semungkisensis]|uniref:DUF5683 domain-containing protein n=1 Tax=Leptospira semungkisensis TaxID=2484985 RepID=A0A4R9FXU0_9LEPT|nr:DUF5683 domain-containing protein [Leptospira semungkisensis]TGK03856.1 hypothetical protein EHO59_10020 [Leptospira semungkisensis]